MDIIDQSASRPYRACLGCRGALGWPWPHKISWPPWPLKCMYKAKMD